MGIRRKTRKKCLRGGSHGHDVEHNDGKRIRLQTAEEIAAERAAQAAQALAAERAAQAEREAQAAAAPGPAVMVMGKFQPFTKGHLESVVLQMLENALINNYTLYICTSDKENYTQEKKDALILQIKGELAKSPRDEKLKNDLRKATNKKSVEEELIKLVDTRTSEKKLGKVASKQASETSISELQSLIKEGKFVNLPTINDTPLHAGEKVAMIRKAVEEMKENEIMIDIARTNGKELSRFIDEKVIVESFGSLFPAIKFVEEKHPKQRNILYCGTDRFKQYEAIIKKQNETKGWGWRVEEMKRVEVPGAVSGTLVRTLAATDLGSREFNLPFLIKTLGENPSKEDIIRMFFDNLGIKDKALSLEIYKKINSALTQPALYAAQKIAETGEGAGGAAHQGGRRKTRKRRRKTRKRRKTKKYRRKSKRRRR